VEQDYFRIDPVVIAGRNRFLPIDWLTVEHDKPEARHLFAEAESYGVGRHGITLPIRGPAGERALFHDHRECDGRTLAPVATSLYPGFPSSGAPPSRSRHVPGRPAA
jgi:hypothetical protein